MSAVKVTEATHLCRRLDRTRHNAFQRRFSDLLLEGFRHRVSGLADGDHQDARIRIQMVKIFTNAQYPTLTMHVPLKRLKNRGFGQSVTKDFASRITHSMKLRFGIGVSHGQDYKDRSCTIS